MPKRALRLLELLGSLQMAFKRLADSDLYFPSYTMSPCRLHDTVWSGYINDASNRLLKVGV
jgi:hypothetical protein